MIGKLVALVSGLVGGALVLLARCYQAVLRPILPRACRFHPSCSEYFILAVRKYGPVRGAWKGVRRIGHCHPWHPGGVDWP